jgi:phospholipid/cholesterol/gamma-HCH transport system substrate-binding protein
MKTKPIDNFKLGAFVLAGLLFLIFSLYTIGRNRNVFGSTFTLRASFHNVNGLTPGNNVRFSGIDVGTVRKIEIENDTSILVTMVIDRKARNYIKKNSVAAVGTDGLMGNKLININTNPAPSPPVEEGEQIQSLKPIETDEMLRTLNTTNSNFEIISNDLKNIIQKINSSNSLWRLLSDTAITMDLKLAVRNIKIAGNKAVVAGDEIIGLTRSANKGEGLIGSLLMDTTLTSKLRISLNAIHHASLQADSATNNLNYIVTKVKQGEGTIGHLLKDTLLFDKLYMSIDNIEQGTDRFSENMEAMRHNFLFRNYFKKIEKEKKKNQK